jgi:hypothetical protein
MGKRHKQQAARRAAKVDGRVFTRADLQRALRALDFVFQEEQMPQEARFRRSVIVMRLAKYHVTRALAMALIEELVSGEVFRVGSDFYEIRNTVSLDGREQTTEFIAHDCYLHTTPRKWFEYVNARCPALVTRGGVRKRATRTAKIDRLVREVKEHLLAARDHAHSSEAATGTPALLPRPTQKELAKRAGVSPIDVSRCLRDDAANELRVLWTTAQDLEQVRKWRGQPNRKRRK